MELPIKAQRLYIDEFDEGMAESVHQTSIDEDNRRFVPDEVFETVDEAREIISSIISWYSEKDTALVYAIFLNDGRHIGYIQAVPIPNGWEIGYHVTKPFTCNGYATEAVNAFLPHIMYMLGISKIHGVCHADNIASRKVLEKCGFRLEYEGIDSYKGAEARICRYVNLYEFQNLEKMSEFFDTRADIYDIHMLDDLGLDEFYEAIDTCFTMPVNRLLDLGCGTGLELERLFARFPDMDVTGIDMSPEMLKKLLSKFPGKTIRLICGSYFDEDFCGIYDAALSTYSLHHFSAERKLSLYKKIYVALDAGGVFVFGDYTVSTIERKQELLAYKEAKRREQGISDGEYYHIDMPFTPETEIRLMRLAGFSSTEVVRQWESTSIIIARK